MLLAFCAFAQDRVVMTHNAAFDMCFLQAIEGVTGVRFDQPVLDTLVLPLPGVIHPRQKLHGLEAMAQRLDAGVLVQCSMLCGT